MLVVSGRTVRAENINGAQRGQIDRDEASFFQQAALSMVCFRFQNGGHFLKAIGLLQESTAIHAMFQDNDGNDPYNLIARYHTIPGAAVTQDEFSVTVRPPADPDIGTHRVVDGPGGFTDGYNDGFYYRELRKPSDEHVLVLRGFRFRYLQDDHKTRRIAVMPNRNDTRIRVTFGDNDLNDRYEVTIQYGYLPPALVRDVIDVSLPPATDALNVRFERPAAPAVIAGFSFEFSDHDDKHIANFCVDVERGQLECNSGDTRNSVDMALRVVTLTTG